MEFFLNKFHVLTFYNSNDTMKKMTAQGLLQKGNNVTKKRRK